MGLRVGIGIRTTADKIGPLPQRLFKQAERFGLLGDPLLSEGTDFEINREGVVLPQPKDSLERTKAGTRIDLDKAAHPVGAVEDRLFDDEPGAGVNVLDGKAGLGPRRFGHRLLQRALAKLAA